MKRSPGARRGRWAIALTSLVGVVAAVALVVILMPPAFLSADDRDETPEPSPQSPAVPVSDSREGGVYIEGDVGFPSTTNPLLAESASERAVASLLYRGLFKLQTNGDPAPDLADAWEVSDDGLRYEVAINPDLQWHDGEPFTVDDVLFTISLVQDSEFPGDASLARFWRGITVDRIDDSNVSFTLKEPYSGLLHYLTLPILPRHIYGGVLPTDLLDDEYAWTPVGTGPYALEDVDEDAGELRFAAWNVNGIDPNIDEVVFRYFESRGDVLEAFQDEEIDGMAYVPVSALDDGERFPAGTNIYAPSLPGYTALYFNLRHPYFRDVETRQAIELAIDRTALIDQVLAGQAVEGSSPIPSMLSAHRPGSHATFDPERARALLEEAGWRVGSDEQFRQRDGERFILPLLVNGDDPQRVAVAQVIQEQLADVGVAVDIQALSGGEVHGQLASRQFTTALYGWVTETGDPDCFQMWHSSQADEGMNFAGFTHPEADELLIAARQSTDVTERNEHYAEFQSIFAEQVPAVVLFYPRYHFALSARVEGAEPEPVVKPGDRVRQIPKWEVRGSS